MTERAKYRPFTGDSDKSIRLTDAPLELVLCQVRWPELTFLQEDRLRPLALQFGEGIADYPIFSEGKEINYIITPEGVTQNVVGSVYQWTSADQTWHVSLAKRFFTLYCTKYSQYPDFDKRLRGLLEQLRLVVKVPMIERVGVRYVNRIVDEAALEDLNKMISPQVLGYQALPLEIGEASLKASNNVAIYSIGDCNLQVRSGIVPPGETVDPALAPLASRPSWVLDLDASTEGRWILDTDEVADRAGHLSDIAYDFFKMVVTEEFEDQFGGSQ